MCRFCVEHGEGKRWYLQASNYAFDLESDLNRRGFMVDFVRNFETKRWKIDAGLGEDPPGRGAPQLVRQVGRGDDRLGGDAAPVQAGPAQRLTLDERGPPAEDSLARDRDRSRGRLLHRRQPDRRLREQLHRQAERAGAGEPVHRAQHRDDAPGAAGPRRRQEPDPVAPDHVHSGASDLGRRWLLGHLGSVGEATAAFRQVAPGDSSPF